jgi:hypothetical protein
LSDREHEAWVIAAAGDDVTRRFEAPKKVDGWDERPWVRLRPLTAREALRRDSLGLEESYELGPDGAARELRRSYDHEAMMQYELQQCLVEWKLPMAREDGTVEAAGPEALEREELLDRLPTGLMAWLVECLDTVNMRRAGDAEVLSEAKKG